MNTIWHAGFAVPDLAAAKAELGALLNLTWRPEVVRSLHLATPTEEIDVDCRVTFSLGGPFAVELWESIPGTPLETPQGGWFHHLGYWVDNWEGEAARLEALGASSVLRNGDNPLLNRAPGGFLVEPCNLHREQPYLRDLYPPTSPHFGEPELPA